MAAFDQEISFIVVVFYAQCYRKIKHSVLRDLWLILNALCHKYRVSLIFSLVVVNNKLHHFIPPEPADLIEE